MPFLLVLHPALLFMGDTGVVESALGIFTATVGIALMAVAFEGWLLKGVLKWERVLFFIAGALLVPPSVTFHSGAGFSHTVSRETLANSPP